MYMLLYSKELQVVLSLFSTYKDTYTVNMYIMTTPSISDFNFVLLNSSE